MPESLADWVTLQAERRPDAVAVSGEERTLTYAGLESLSSRVARLLRDGGCAPGDRVALLTPKSPEAIASLVGIYKADAIYVPIDPASPPERARRILASSGSRWILAGHGADRLLHDLAQGPPADDPPAIGWIAGAPPESPAFPIRFTVRDLEAAPATPPARRRGGDDAAHILFTSGSTGAPKGVVITHANVNLFVRWAVRHFRLDPTDRLSGHPPLHFDLSMFDIFGTFAAGAQLHLVPHRLSLLPHKLAAFIRERRLTQWFSVPSVLNYMAKFEVVRQGDFPHLRRLLWCGEVFPTPALRYWMKRLPHAVFVNLYGPTETTIASSHYTVPSCPESDLQPIPLGAPCEGETLSIRDERLRPVGDGATGELCIGGAGLSPGYWNDEERTRDAFRADPDGAGGRIYRTGDVVRRGEDGEIYFVGRLDSQIKSRGYRIELGEIEAGLGTLPELRESAVVAIPTDGFEGTLICCAFAPADGAEVTPGAVRERLSGLLPVHMLPSRWETFAHLPRNANGKIDRAQLKESFALRETAAARQL